MGGGAAGSDVPPGGIAGSRPVRVLTASAGFVSGLAETVSGLMPSTGGGAGDTAFKVVVLVLIMLLGANSLLLLKVQQGIKVEIVHIFIFFSRCGPLRVA